mmetsp:Transcript_89174/g.277220  ORF Transcript_89174/g.277220 Transcript_89174/m.277220 type:complete len:556 (-) Transcript_89174:395-2062(-)
MKGKGSSAPLHASHPLPELGVLEHHVLELLHVDEAVPVHVEVLDQLVRLLQRDGEPCGQVLRPKEPRPVLVQAKEELLSLVEEGVLLGLRRSLLGPLLEEVVALVVHHHKGGEVLDLDLPHCLHPQLLHVQDLHPFDALRAERGRHAADGAEVEAAVLLASLGHLRGAVALANHDHGAPECLEGADVGVHAPSSGGPEGSRGHARWCLGGTCIVDGVLLDVVRQAFPVIDHLLHPSMRNVARDNDGPREGQARLHRIPAQELEVLLHGVVQVNLDDLSTAVQRTLLHVGQVLGGLPLQLLEEDALLRDPGLGLAVGGAGDADADRAGGAVPGQPDHADVMHEVLSTVLRSDAQVLGYVLDLCLPLEVAECSPSSAAGGGKPVQVLAAGQLDRLQIHVSGQATDDESQVVRRARGRAYVRDLLGNELREGLLVQRAFSLLEKLRLIGTATAFCNEQEVVCVALLRHHVDLGRQVGPCVRLLEHGLRGHLRVPQVPFGVRLVDAPREVILVFPISEHVAPALRQDRCSARVLARWHNHSGRHARVLQELKGNKAVVA